MRTKKLPRDKEEHCQIIKGSFHQEDIRILNALAPDNRVSKHVEQKPRKLKRETNNSTITVGDFGQQFAKLLDTNQKGYGRGEQQCQPTGSNQYVQNTPPNKSMTYVFVKPMELSTR